MTSFFELMCSVFEVLFCSAMQIILLVSSLNIVIMNVTFFARRARWQISAVPWQRMQSIYCPKGFCNVRAFLEFLDN